MAMRNVPDRFEIDKIRFQDCFSAPSLKHFAVLITGSVLTVGTHTVSRVVFTVEAHESEPFGSIDRFFSRARWETDRVAAVIFLLRVETFFPGVSEVILVIDDTLNNHVARRSVEQAFSMRGPLQKAAGTSDTVSALCS